MIIKGISGKVYRFFLGRIKTGIARGLNAGIPETCLSTYPPKDPKQGDRNSPPLVVFFSGDGGWANLTSQVSEHFQDNGFPVLGIDCMQYFWSEKKPEDAARELQETIATYEELWESDQFIFMGYSMGADVLPVITRNLDEVTRKKIKALILLSPSMRVELKFRFIGWLGFQTPKHRGKKILPDLEVLAREIPVICFAGDKESDSLVGSLPESIAKTHTLPGGHHYSGDYITLAQAIEKQMETLEISI